MDPSPFRWGILGTAQIAKKNWKAILHSGNGVVTAVASRALDRSQAFIAECQEAAPFSSAPKALGTYEELIAASDVDGLYIPLPTGIRKEWVVRAARSGKHVVCEKPCAVALADLREMTAICRERNVQFMDGVMFMHSGRLGVIRQALDDKKAVGRIRRIHAVFDFNATEEFFRTNIRVNARLEPHGCLGDLGWYCIRFILWTMKWKLPERVTGRLLSAGQNKDGRLPVPTEFSGELFFVDGISSSFYCSFVTDLQQTVQISGTNGYLELRDFVLPFAGAELNFDTWQPAHLVKGCDFALEPNHRRWAIPESSHSHPNAQESLLFRHFVEQVRTGRLNEAWPDMALQTQQVMEACRQSSLEDSRPIKVS